MKNHSTLRKTLLFTLCLSLSVGFLQTNFVSAATYAESEDNNSRGSANQILSGNDYTGTFDSYDDSDCFKYKATANGTISVKLTCNGPDESIPLLQLGIGTNTSVDNMFCECSDSDISSCDIPVTKGTTYYIDVKNASSTTYEPDENFYYSIRLTLTPNNYVERENNNSRSKATKLTLNKSMIGTNTIDSDTDFYKFTATKSGLLKIKFYHYFDDALSFVFAVGTNSSANNLKEQYSDSDMSAKIRVKKGKTYYVKISTYSNSYSELGSKYKIKAYY